MQYLKADTGVKVVIGPVVAVGDGFTPVTTLAVSTADEAELIKHDAAAVTSISGNTFAAITSADGYYNLTLTAAQLDTEGMLTILINDDSLCLPVRHDFMVVSANVFDSLFAAAATDYLQVDTIQVGGATEDIATETKQNTAQADLDTITGSDGVTLATAQGLYAPAKAGDSMSLLAAAIDAIWDEPNAGHLTAATMGLQSALGSAALADTTITGTPTSTTFTLTAGSAVDDFYKDQLVYILSGTGIGQVRTILSYNGTTKLVTVDEAFTVTPAAADRVAIIVSHVHPNSQIADAVWEEQIGDHSGTSGSVAESLASASSAGDPWGTAIPGAYGAGTAGNILGNRLLGTVAAGTHNPQSGDNYARLGAPAGASVSADVAAVKADSAAILVDTNELQTDWTDGGRLDNILDAAGAAGDPWSTALPGAYGAGTAGKIVGDNIDAVLSNIEADTQSIEADTQDIQSRLPAALIGGRMDSDVEAINNNTAAADNLSKSAQGVVSATAVTGTLTTTTMTTNLTEVTDDHYIGRVIVFITGALAGQATNITDYDGGTKLLTFTALTEAPSNSDEFVIV